MTQLNFRFTIYQFVARLGKFNPSIWRRIQFQDCQVAKFHEVLLTIFGWTPEHSLRCTARALGSTHAGAGSAGREPKWLSDLVPRDGMPLSIKYEIGEHEPWELEVQFEGFALSAYDERYPLCVAGERAGVPDDDMRPNELRWALSDLASPADRRQRSAAKHAHAWQKWSYDPAILDLAALNASLRRFTPHWRTQERMVFVPMNLAERTLFFDHVESTSQRFDWLREFASDKGVWAYLAELSAAAQNLLNVASQAGPGELQWRMEHLAGRLYRSMIEFEDCQREYRDLKRLIEEASAKVFGTAKRNISPERASRP